MRRSSILFYLAVLSESTWSSFPGGNCIEPCIAEMQQSLEATPLLQSEQLGQLSLSSLVSTSSNKELTERSFYDICQAYTRVDLCLHSCEKVSQHSASIRKTYAGIRFICVEHRDEFFRSLPCLAEHEKIALQQCRPQINDSLAASNRFSVTVLRKEHHNLRSHFEMLCKKLGSMIECVEPVTRAGCGDQAAKMMLRFITVGFSSFEQLYSQLGISDQLPAACKSLLSLQKRTVLPERRHYVLPQASSEYSVFSSTSSTPHIPIILFSYLILF
ncbi:CPG4 domain-containing protein [Caenorhabditis elegans]|uniref:CPG4 domain-containing protein n=2 Tax=Caenorhabditis elegans TaxID=6239 RepID=Q8ITY7_CAEEL|nr:CPG4 domain-containing protein [Caenorhabditis elegans]CCD65338.1 CPG4 domain-containing protein [Caenorhabditis elegans]|eukprot:NP_493656.2 Uncharacterized protein CELE_C50D2.6 [Caenorhabditis elegans]